LVVAFVMSSLGLRGGWQVLQEARRELGSPVLEDRIAAAEGQMTARDHAHDRAEEMGTTGIRVAITIMRRPLSVRLRLASR
jgi:hypothetical protein